MLLVAIYYVHNQRQWLLHCIRYSFNCENSMWIDCANVYVYVQQFIIIFCLFFFRTLLSLYEHKVTLWLLEERLNVTILAILPLIRDLPTISWNCYNAHVKIIEKIYHLTKANTHTWHKYIYMWMKKNKKLNSM